MSASDSPFDAPCAATPLAGSIASDDSGDSAFDAPAVAERTRAARRRKVFASESVETLCAFILVDGIIRMPHNFRHTVWASSTPPPPQYSENTCAVAGIVFFSWSLRLNSAGVTDDAALELQRIAAKSCGRRPVQAFVEYAQTKSYYLDEPISIERSHVDYPNRHVDEWTRKIDDDGALYFRGSFDGDSLQDLCKQHGAPLPKSVFRLAYQHAELLFKEYVKPIQIVPITQRGVKHAQLQLNFPSQRYIRQ